MIRWLPIWVLALAALAVSPASADADTFYAAPSPQGGGTDCTQGVPCLLEFAVETKAAINDEVVALPGNYVLDDELTIDTTLDVHGLVGQPPKISIDSLTGTGLDVEGTASSTRLADLTISSDVSGPAVDLSSAQAVIAERLHVSGGGSAACRPSFSLDPVNFPAVLRDSVCFNAGSGDAVGLPIGIATTITARLVNVTAVATGGSGDGIHLNAGSGCNCLINATNVIAAGNEAGGGVDVRATTGAGGTIATVALDHSNYSSEGEAGPGVENVTNPGTGNNQSDAPAFESGLGNFHQAAGSPTIDKGATNPLNGGSLDFDGEARAQGESQDIGADELTVLPPSLLSPAPPPTGPADLLSAKAKAKKLIVTVACAAPGGCPGSQIALRTAKKLDLSKIAVAAKRKRILLAKGSFSLAAGERRTVRLKLRKQGRRLFKARRKVRAKATITSPAGTSAEKLKIKRK